MASLFWSYISTRPMYILILMEKKSQKTTGTFIRKNMVENLHFLRRISIVKSLKKTQ